MLKAKRLRIMVVLVALGLVIQYSVVGSALAANGDIYKIKNGSTCLDYNHDFYSCQQGNGAQKWTETSATGGTWKFRNTEGGIPWCLEGANGPGNVYIFSQCNAGDGSQRWTLIAATGGGYKIEQSYQGGRLCLDADNYMDNCAAGDGAQVWNLVLTS